MYCVQYSIFGCTMCRYTRTKLPHAALLKHVTKLWVGVVVGRGRGRGGVGEGIMMAFSYDVPVDAQIEQKHKL